MATEPADPFIALRRCVALLEAGRPLPLDLHHWLVNALARLLRGDDPHILFGLKAHPGRRKPATKLRYEARDRALAELLAMSTGGEVARAETVVAWLDSPPSAPPPARPLVDEVRRQHVGWPTDPRALSRAAARAPPLAP